MKPAKDPPRVKEADGHVASRELAQRDVRAGQGFSRLFMRSLWSDLPGARLVLAFPHQAVGRPGVSA